MTDPSGQVIDLTNSFTLANHSAIANRNVIIDLLDDSYESNVFPERRVLQEPTLNDCQDISIVEGIETPVQLVRRRKKYTKAKKRVEKSPRPKKEVSDEPIRERSPIGMKLAECPICLESFDNNRLASTKCGHVFCERCLEQALRSEKKCPTCRQSLRGKNAYHPLYLGPLYCFEADK